MTSIAALLAIALVATQPSAPAPAPPIKVKVVVVTMFERGLVMGDQLGEFQLWVERAHLNRMFPFPEGARSLRMNSSGVLGICTGVGTAKAAAAIMALGLDPRFDLRAAYWLVAGIAGIDPADGSTGSAAWAEWIVDGDLAHEIDAREIPPEWPTGYIPLRMTMPYQGPHTDDGGEFHLQPALVDWAYRLTADVPLDDSDALRAQRAHYPTYPAARTPPRVLKGDVISSSTFWHGRKMSEWANAWVRYHTDGDGNYVMTAMEDAGTMQSLVLLDRAHRVDKRRVLVLRTASNFDQQRAGISAPASLAETMTGNFPAFVPAVEAAYSVGSVVVNEIVKNWATYRVRLPH